MITSFTRPRPQRTCSAQNRTPPVPTSSRRLAGWGSMTTTSRLLGALAATAALATAVTLAATPAAAGPAGRRPDRPTTCRGTCSPPRLDRQPARPLGREPVGGLGGRAARARSCGRWTGDAPSPQWVWRDEDAVPQRLRQQRGPTRSPRRSATPLTRCASTSHDGGLTWTVSHQNTLPTAFYDCMTFTNKKDGYILSIPSTGSFSS